MVIIDPLKATKYFLLSKLKKVWHSNKGHLAEYIAVFVSKTWNEKSKKKAF